MISSFKVANFILEQLESKQETISGMALQRYIFLLDAAHIIRYHQKLITEDFTISQYGPLVQTLNENIPEHGAYIHLQNHRRIIQIELAPNYNVSTPLLPKDFEYKQEMIQNLNCILKSASAFEIIQRFADLNLQSKFETMFESDILDFFTQKPELQIWHV